MTFFPIHLLWTTINLLLTWPKIREKINFNYFLNGLWYGTLHHYKDEQLRKDIKTEIYLSFQFVSGNLKGYAHYVREECGKACTGFDVLTKPPDDSDESFLFSRVFHESTEGAIIKDTKIFSFVILEKEKWFSSAIRVVIELDDGYLIKGRLVKQR